MVFAYAAVVVLCILDAVLTLDLLGRGGEEANPVMRALLSSGHETFFAVKVLITVIGGAILLRLRALPVARAGLVITVVGYGLLTGYHAYGRSLHAAADIGLGS